MRKFKIRGFTNVYLVDFVEEHVDIYWKTSKGSDESSKNHCSKDRFMALIKDGTWHFVVENKE